MPPKFAGSQQFKEDADGSIVSSSDVSSEGDSYTSSDHHTSTRSLNNSKTETDGEKLARKESAAVFRLRLLVFSVLLIATVAMSLGVYFITSRAEEEEYESQFKGAAKIVLETFTDIAESKLGAVAALGVQLIAHGIDHDSNWPFLTLSSFQQRATTALKQSEALYVHVNPLVTRENRDEWEQYAVGEDSHWIQEGLDYQEYVGTFDFLGRNHTKEDNRLNHQPHGDDYWPMWKHDANDQVHVELERGPYLPTWQTSPIVYEGTDVNENILGNFRTQAANLSYYTDSVVISEFLFSPAGGIEHDDPHTSLYALLMSIRAQKKQEYEGDAISQVFFPIYDGFGEGRMPVAVMTAWIHWRNYFVQILPDSLRGILIVLSDSCGGVYTYTINEGEVYNIGQGDHHDPNFDNHRKTVTYSSVKNIADGTKLGLPMNKDHCSVTLDVYPSEQFREIFVSATPLIMTIAVVVVFMFTALIFFVYDRLVEHRQALIMKRATEANAIVTSLFPENIRDKLIASNNQKKEADSTNIFINQNNRLRGYLNGAEQGKDAAPIAELYPHCTVMFADISGFTAWSSSREPAQVFILLQTVYQAFDLIAKRRKVFKVETIGDSYVAVTGLPEAMENHASCMVRFAWDCLTKMNQVTKDLEVALGPDTGDLSMRFGVHSGPVTAGVLQGERARFQLFGDTVNTAARMESTGMRGKIQASKATADIIEATGKGSWLKKRKELVSAKGKGSMQTWWVNPLSSRGSSGSCASGESVQESITNESKGPDIPKTVATTVNQRLVSWMTELLLDDIKKLVHTREYCGIRDSESESLTDFVFHRPEESNLLDEVQDKIKMPGFDAQAAEAQADGDYKDVQVSSVVVDELHQFVTGIASLYRKNPFHNFEHACHVTMSVKKLLKRIVAPELTAEHLEELKAKGGNAKVEIANRLHSYTHGITSDPLTCLAITFSALIHDVDHRGVSNMQLGIEAKEMADKYNNKSIAEQNSLDLAWDILQGDQFQNLRSHLFSSQQEMMRFRQLIVNVVLATDIFDKELNDLRKSRWERAFSGEPEVEQDSDLRATIVIEHIIQASDVSHTMQHWHVYQKWNKCLFKELRKAYREGRMAKDPASFWYQGEIGFFDNYIIPLAKKLKNCGVFGVSSDEYLNYALQNRSEWEECGREIVDSLVEECRQEEGVNEEEEQSVQE